MLRWKWLGEIYCAALKAELARIDATACPDNFFQAWQKYVLDVQTMSAIEQADTGRAIVSVGAAVFTKSLAPLSGVMPENPEELDVARNSVAADWKNIRHVALRYGIRTPPTKYSERVKQQNRA